MPFTPPSTWHSTLVVALFILFTSSSSLKSTFGNVSLQLSQLYNDQVHHFHSYCHSRNLYCLFARAAATCRICESNHKSSSTNSTKYGYVRQLYFEWQQGRVKPLESIEAIESVKESAIITAEDKQQQDDKKK
jgi:hypothetical protein